ncbi:MAG: hypothetical protein EXQ67_06860 [Thermoleophilia bacterium]|nr:hypothetical protein [Thermoleophilia bacterium]
MEFEQMPERLAALPLVLDESDIEALSQPVAIGGVRRTTLLRLKGRGMEGFGEDVTFQDDDRLCTQPTEALWRGVTTLGDVWDRLDQADLFDRPPRYEVVRNYRRWAIEAAALDLALRQANVSLAELLGRSLRPVHFVVSPPRIHLRRFPGLRLKVDSDGVEPGLPIDVIDFKAQGSVALVRRAFDQYPEALFEDPPQIVDGLRVSWDTQIQTVEDIRRLPERPDAINIKPARVGSVRALFEIYEECRSSGIAMYGGGQHELGPGRAQIQVLASLFHSDAPNDVAPAGYNAADPPELLTPSPLVLKDSPGFV